MAGDSARRELLRATRSILRPLVRQLIARGVTFPLFSRLAREVYIDVGTVHFTLPFKKQTDSRVALVTGITRKEIGQVRRGQTPLLRDAAQVDYDLATRVIGRWVSEVPYLSPDGSPLALPYEAPQETASFTGLVGGVGGDIPPRAVLDELLRVGAVELSPQGDVLVVERAYVPAQGLQEKLEILGTDAAELITAIAHNIDHPGDEAFLQRKVHYDNIGARALPEVRERIRIAGGNFAQDINRILAAYDRDRNPAAPGGPRRRAVVAVYYLDEEYESPATKGEVAD